MYWRGITPPTISSTNWNPDPRGSGAMRIQQSPYWPRPPVCFLCFPWPSARARNVSRYAILGRPIWACTPNFARQPPHDDLEVPLPQPADQRLPQFARVLVLERGVFFVQLVQAVRQLLLLPPLLYVDCFRDHRLGERDLGQHDGVLPGGERVVGVGVPQLGHGADVAGAQLGDLESLLALRDAQVVQLLHRLAGGVVHVLAVPHRAGVHAKERHVAYVWLR